MDSVIARSGNIFKKTMNQPIKRVVGKWIFESNMLGNFPRKGLNLIYMYNTIK